MKCTRRRCESYTMGNNNDEHEVTMSIRKELASLGGVLVLLVAGGCASSGTPQMASAEPDLAEIICRKEASVGSRLPKRVCKSRQQWQIEAEVAKHQKRGLSRGTAPIVDTPTASGN